MKYSKKIKWITATVVIIAILSTLLYFNRARLINIEAAILSDSQNAEQSEYFMGICVDSLNVERAYIGKNESLSTILPKYNISYSQVHTIAELSEPVFNVKNIKVAQEYFALTSKDSTSTLKYLVYAKNPIDYIIYCFADTLSVSLFSKEVTTTRKYLYSEITSSLYMAIKNKGASDELGMLLSDIYQWTIDFYGIKSGDNFTVIYDELSVDSTVVGIKDIVAARFSHSNKEYYAIGFVDTLSKGYWDEEGESLKKSFLKAPLKFSRISSKFTASRMHPVLRVVKAHYGVDYAAPSGTPVWAVADGTVISRSFDNKGGGNFLKIKHSVSNGRYTTGYLHLKGYAKGITVGTRVSQGQTIGYVGSTGTSTGPHLDFRIWDKGKPVNPLKMTQEKGKPISNNYKDSFMQLKDSMINILKEKTPKSDE